MNSEGAFGRGSEPRANLMAISQELAAERYNSAEEEVRRSLALRLSLCSAARLQRKTLVSSRYCIGASWLSRSAFSSGLRIDRARPRATANQNPRGRSAAREKVPEHAALSLEARGPGGPPEPRGSQWLFPRRRPPGEEAAKAGFSLRACSLPSCQYTRLSYQTKST